MKRFLNTKILWGVFSVIIGISLTNVAFSFLEGKILSPGDEASVIQLIAPEEQDKAEQFKYFYINKDTNGGPKISAKAYLVGDLNTGEVILAKNQDQKFPIASLSKLTTALITKEIMEPNDALLISKRALDTEGKNGGLKIGEEIETSDLLYTLLLESSNDAAEILAEHFGRD